MRPQRQPVRLGWEYGEPVHNSCYIVNDPANRVSQFFVIFHEVGHNFTCAAGAFATLVNASPDYGFPIDDAAWPTLLACAQQKISARTFNQQAICEAVATLFADGFESGDTASWSATLP